MAEPKAKDSRPGKYAVSYVYILFHLCALLEHGTFVSISPNSPIGDTARGIKDER
jgi:hypothetical protein